MEAMPIPDYVRRLYSHYTEVNLRSTGEDVLDLPVLRGMVEINGNEYPSVKSFWLPTKDEITLLQEV